MAWRIGSLGSGVDIFVLEVDSRRTVGYMRLTRASRTAEDGR